MVSDAEALAELLEDSILRDRPISPIPIPSTSDVALAVGCDPDAVLPAWHVLRDRLERTDRWPVVVAGWGEPIGPALFTRFPFDHNAGHDTSVEGIIARATTIDPEAVIADLAREDDAWDPLDQLEFELDSTRLCIGTAPGVEDVHRALGDKPTHAELDRWLFEWEERHAPPPFESTAHLEPFEPTGLEVAVLLLPTPICWHVPAYISFYGAEGHGGAEKLISVLRSWHERYGAELVAHYGTMLELAVGKPPRTLDEAWTLAREHELIAPCTTILPGVPLRQHARALVDRSTWFLHERP